MSVLHTSVVPVLLVSPQSYCSCLPLHRYLPSCSRRCGKYQSPSCFIGLVLSWVCLQIHLVQPYNCTAKISSAECLQPETFLVHHKWAQMVLLSRPLCSNYCKTFCFSTGSWQLGPSMPFQSPAAKVGFLSHQFAFPIPLSPPSMDALFFTLCNSFFFRFHFHTHALPA